MTSKIISDKLKLDDRNIVGDAIQCINGNARCFVLLFLAVNGRVYEINEAQKKLTKVGKNGKINKENRARNKIII